MYEKLTAAPDARGYYGPYGGCYVPEILVPAMEELTRAYHSAKEDSEFQRTLRAYLRDYVGRPTPLYFADHLTDLLGGARIFLKREDLCHTGSHKLNNALGQALIAKRMGKPRLIAETGAGQHGVATATVAALLGFECEVYMGEEDVRRQALNVFRMRLLGTRVIPVTSGTKTLKDAINEGMRDWATNVDSTHYVMGTVAGPHPFPEMVRDFQSVIGQEARAQILEKIGRLPDCLIACVGGGSNAMGLFHPFLNDPVQFIGVEAAGDGIETGRHAASLGQGSPGVLHGSASYMLQDENGQVIGTHSISAGLDYPGVGPEHSEFKDAGRATYVSATDREALAAFQTLSRTEGIIPALESSHAIAHALKLAPTLPRESVIIVNLSGRGDKDVEQVERILAEG